MHLLGSYGGSVVSTEKASLVVGPESRLDHLHRKENIITPVTAVPQ